MTALPAPSRTGVRIAGDLYQWLFAWQGCLHALRGAQLHTDNPVIAVGVEVNGVGNLDDVVLHRATPPHDYAQVKYAVDSQTPVNEDYLLTASSPTGTSILAKIFTTWQDLTTRGEPFQLRLISNRAPDPHDPLVALRDSRTQLLLPHAGTHGPASQLGQARQRWATALNTTEEELLRFLSELRFDIARDPEHVVELVQQLMFAAGLRHNEAAVHSGIDWVARQVRDGHRRLDLDMIRQAVDDLGRGPARAILSVATLKPDPVRNDADYALDWTDRFEGDDPYSKRRPAPPATWAQFQGDIEEAPRRLPRDATAIAVTGSLRLAPAFLLGTSFRMVTGTDLAVSQRGQSWSTSETYEAPLQPLLEEILLDLGNDLAVAVAVAADLAPDVEHFIREQNLPQSGSLSYAHPAALTTARCPTPRPPTH